MNSPNEKPLSLSRRGFLGRAAGAGAALAAPYIGWKTTVNGQSPNESLRWANFGANGRAWGDLVSMAGVPNSKLVAVAEVDPNRLGNVAKGFPDAKVYADWRELLDKEAGNIDAVVVGTPDHMHAPIAMSGMQLGKHAYCEKPLTRLLHESRALREYAEANGLMTQMGIQVSSSSGNRTAVKALQDGLVGKVRSVHSMNPKSWGSMAPLPAREDPIPEGMNWDHWIGVAKMRPFVAGEFHPSNWRKRIGYGTGTLGDMGCHIYHPWFMGLNSPVTLSIVSHGPGPVDADSWPLDAKVQYRMKGNDLSDGDFDFVWYDGKQFPDAEVAAAVGGVENIPKSGSVVIGTSGALAIPHGGGGPRLYRDGKPSEETIEQLPSEDHHKNFAAAIRGEISEKPRAHFDYAGRMTECVLFGTVAMRLPGVELKWDDAAGQFVGNDAANAMVSEPYRAGWEVKGI
ncbi:MAG: Gfo/Idh/MocA family oxidoreductase [Verrucomicrobiae bacterium]|nr:Gfo/Idh/MocA family oxidoreductase [Verrucomicrobiae bacterium]